LTYYPPLTPAPKGHKAVAVGLSPQLQLLILSWLGVRFAAHPPNL